MAGDRAPRQSSSTSVFGRDEIFEELDRRLVRGREGHGSGLLLVGAGGAGKTQVLQAAREVGVRHEYRILSGHALPQELPPPFSLLRDLLASHRYEEPGPAADLPDLGSFSVFLAPVSSAPPHPATHGHAAEPKPTEDEVNRILAPFGRSTLEGAAGGQERLQAALLDEFQRLAEDRPLLILVDDLHFADSSTLDFLRRFAADLPGFRTVVVATVGVPSEVPEKNRKALDALGQSSAFQSLPLRPLTVPEVGQYVRWILGGHAPDPKDILRWHAQTQGNPLFIEQLVRSDPGYGTTATHAPAAGGQSMADILVSRVRALGETERRVLTYAAVIGKEFEFADLAAVSGQGEESVTESLDHLVQSGLLREKGGEVYEFVTEALRAMVYTELTETRRRILHRKAGLALEAKGHVDDAELARQFFLGRDNDRAVRYNVAAAQSAARAFAFETAVTHYARALEAERRRPNHKVESEIRYLTDQGRLLAELFRLRESEAILTEAVDLARSHSGLDLELGRALLGLAQCRYLRGEYPNAEVLATQAWSYLTTAGNLRDRMDAHRVLGVVCMRMGNVRQAEAHHRAVVEIAEREGTPLELGHALIDVANLVVTSDPVRFKIALELYTRAAKLFGESGDFGSQARVLMNQGVLEWTANRTDDALRDLELAIVAAERSRSPRWIGYCNINLAQLLAERGRPELARPAMERAAQATAPVGDGLADQQVLMTRAMIAHSEHDYAQAETHYQASLNLARNLHLPSETAELLMRMAQLSHDRGDDVQARERLTSARTSGLLDHRPDFAGRLAALEQAIAVVSPPAK